ncbi:MAG: AAA family ATPase [Spirochaetaceae bacterium]|nr:AAA family ATPase [Spirochaetaceae bacterium]
MFLKSLEVFGFKSFADRTHIEFADGVTALLGPNGCGKSNVVDAVKWVLGEQAAKNMRAEKMEDVIFNGTESRKPLNVAEVSLTIANEQGLLPIDYSEITIKRRLYRSGESEYFINNNLAKLKDVRELFWDTGVGKAAYSVMEQGKIDQILSSKPEDRRYLFEEAAGITRFKVKRAEAERKLERTEENMRQVEGILGEVKKSYDSLKVQAEKTIQYRELKEQIFNYELDIQLLRLKGFTQDKTRKENDIKEISQKRDIIRKEIDEINATIVEHTDEVDAMQKQVNSIQTEIYGLAIEQKAKSDSAKELVERQKEAKLKVQQLEGRKSNIEEQIEQLNEDISEQESSLHELNKRLAEIAKNISDFNDNILLAENQITENKNTTSQINDQIQQINQKIAELQVSLEAITEDIVKELDSKLKDAGYSSQAREKAEENINHLLAQISILASGRKNLFSDFINVGNYSEGEVKKISENALSSFTEIENQLQEIKNAFAEYTKITPAFIDEFLSPEGIITKKRVIDQQIQDNKNIINEKQENISSLNEKNFELSTKINEYRNTLKDLELNKVKMEGQVETTESEIRALKRELAGKENSLRELDNEIYTESKKLEDITDQVLEIEGEIASLEHKGRALTKQIEDLERDINSKSKDVSGKQESVKKKSDELAKYQAQLEKYNMDLNTSDIEIRNLKENFRDSHSRDLMEFEERMYTITVQPAELREKLASSRQKIKDLGSVNFMAPEEFAETKERYDFLSTQIADLVKARDDLKRITEEIRAESTELFLATYNKIKKNFHNMFRRLFGGGRAELRLIDPQNVLESGVDIFAQPPGKKLENIALLSGGEKTMTAVALMFATYMVRPSPFCLLDEIDAALDEHNVTRFVQTLRDFANVSQYIIITHNKKTVTGASTMLGVTMEESGVSKVITIKLDNDKGSIVSVPEAEPFEEEDVEPEKDVYIPPHPIRRNRNKEENAESQSNTTTE